jgi:multidrug efflux system outer membrane protein
VLVSLRDAESALTTYAQDFERNDDLSAAQARAREAEQQADRLNMTGKIDYLPLLDAQRTLADVDSAVAASHGALATDQVAVFLALGGGWE